MASTGTSSNEYWRGSWSNALRLHEARCILSIIQRFSKFSGFRIFYFTRRVISEHSEKDLELKTFVFDDFQDRLEPFWMVLGAFG